MTTFAILVASQNHNIALGNTIKDEVAAQGGAAELVDLVALDLPLYSSTVHETHGVPDAIDPLREVVSQSSGVIFVSPEYNGGIPPALTNALAWLSVTEKNWRDAFQSKIAGIATFSGGDGMLLVTGLRIQLAYIGLTVIGRPLRGSFSKPVTPESCTAFVVELINKA